MNDKAIEELIEKDSEQRRKRNASKREQQDHVS